MKQKRFAYFLPQFYPTPENDFHWGKGFTDWVNVRRVKPLFENHRQPLEPGELGYYDLSVSTNLKKVIDYSQNINIDGLIYWHYWFGNDFKTLERVAENHLKNKGIKQKFCFAWANGNWTKSWKGDDKTLIFKQTYSDKSANDHYAYLKQFFKDERYIVHDNKFLFQVNNVINGAVLRHMKILNEKCLVDFNKKIHFLIPKTILAVALDEIDFSLTSYPPGEIYSQDFLYKYHRLLKILRIKKSPIVVNKSTYLYNFKKFLNKNPSILPCILSGWDNTPRYGKEGILVDSCIEELISGQLKILNESKLQHPIILIKAYNEWAEGNILEPFYFKNKKYNPGQFFK